ncbi:11707_t:CDS:2, partial [Dentiscutata erythropus]
FNLYNERSIRTFKGKEKATDSENSVEQIGSSSGRQNECDKSTRYSEDGNSSEQNKLVESLPEVSTNAAAQKQAINEITIAEKKLTEFTIFQQIFSHPLLLFQHPNLYNQIHEFVKSGLADEKRQKEVVKVRIIENLRKNLEENYIHHHPAWVLVAGVLYTDIHEHPDSYYCLASVFSNMSVVISQNDKAKIDLGILAIGQTFRILQSINDLICVVDYDFVIGFEQKLVPSVYLLMKLGELNNELRTGQLAIFVWRQWSLGTSSFTHIQDLDNLTINSQYDNILKTSREIWPIWV